MGVLLSGVTLGLLSGRTLSRLVRAPGLALDVARVLPELVVVRHRLRAQPDLRKMFLEATPPSPRTRSPADQRFRTVRAIRWGTRLLRLNPNGDCLLRSVAIYTALRRQGWPVAFVSGVRRAGGRVQGHAWVEHQGRVLDELSEPANRQLYKETFRWPASSGSG